MNYVLPSPTLVWSTPLVPPGRCGGRMHQHSTSGMRIIIIIIIIINNKKVTLHMLTHGAMRGCGLTSWVAFIHDKFRDIKERNVTTRSET